MLNGSLGAGIREGFCEFCDLIDEALFAGEACPASRNEFIKFRIY